MCNLINSKHNCCGTSHTVRPFGRYERTMDDFHTGRNSRYERRLFRCDICPVWEMSSVRDGRCERWPVWEIAGMRIILSNRPKFWPAWETDDSHTGQNGRYEGRPVLKVLLYVLSYDQESAFCISKAFQYIWTDCWPSKIGIVDYYLFYSPIFYRYAQSFLTNR